MNAALLAAISTWSASLDIPPSLLQAIVEVESGGESCAMRYERFYRWVYDVDAAGPYRGDNHWQVPSPVRWQTRHTELIGQKTSWGPMQIMGATARELGFRGWFPELCGPLGIEYGARYLRKQFDRYEGESWEDAIEAYNAGRRNTDDGERYREKVMRKWRRLDTT